MHTLNIHVYSSHTFHDSCYIPCRNNDDSDNFQMGYDVRLWVGVGLDLASDGYSNATYNRTPPPVRL